MSVIENLKSTTFGGRRFTRKQILEIQKTVKIFANLSRRELGHTICEHYKWFTPTGKNKIQTCLNALEEMERTGAIKLPPKKICKKRHQKQIVRTQKTEEQAHICCELKELMPIKLVKVIEKTEINCWNEFVDRYHYLGYKRPIGTHLRYYIVDEQGRKLGCLLFSFASWSLDCRDKWIGWSEKEREKNLKLVVNNNRFLIFPWVNVKHLASKALSIASQIIGGDWEKLYGYNPVLLETFVDITKYSGTCYRAANWQRIGETMGLKQTTHSEGKSKKEVYVYPLTGRFRSVLTYIKKEVSKKKRNDTKKKFVSDDPFTFLWSKIIGIVSKVACEFDQQWQQRQRIINTLLLILFIFRLVFSKNKQGYQTTVIELWEQCRKLGVSLPQQKPVAASAFCKARTKLDEDVFKTINSEIVNVYKTTMNIPWHNHKLFAVDGSKINLPRQLINNNGYNTPNSEAYYPQGLLSCIYQLKKQIPVDFDLVAHQDERKAALTHLKVLEPNDIVVYDRGYFSYGMLYTHKKRGIHAIFRLPKNTSNPIKDFMESDKTDRIITITPPAKRKADLKRRYPEIEFIPLQLRLVKYVINDTTYTLGTTLLDSKIYKIEELADVYHSRWGIEELYKISKRLIEVTDFHSKSERGVKQELFASFVLITLSRIFANQIENNLTGKLNTSASNKFKVNLKNCLNTISRNLESLFVKQVALVKKAVNTIMDSIIICRQKKRPNRSYERRSRKPTNKWMLPKEKRRIIMQIVST